MQALREQSFINSGKQCKSYSRFICENIYFEIEFLGEKLSFVKSGQQNNYTSAELNAWGNLFSIGKSRVN